MKAILIATGDEITEGDILNTTGPAIARQLAAHNITIVKHIMVPDDEAGIQAAIESALEQADKVFTTGGLGPTSDDRTRFALAKALGRELVFDDANWQSIVDRLSAYKLHVHEDNRQQAYFPEGAEIFENPNGTAAGCGVDLGDKAVYMLPGPPGECMPMFNEHVLPKLPKTQQHKLHWLLIGASEGEIAAELDAALKHIDCQTGYRAEYPYLEIKAWAKSHDDLIAIEKVIEPLVDKFLVSKKNIAASTLLAEKIAREDAQYKVFDAATGGILQSLIQTPKTRGKLNFLDSADEADVVITGLDTFWQGIPVPGHSDVELNFDNKTVSRKLYYRGDSVRMFVAEWVCWQMLER